MSEAHDALAACIAKHGLIVRAEFVPFSKSRNAGEKHKSLNWKVTLMKNERDVLTTDYMAGSGHCPAHNSKPPHGYPNHKSMWERDSIAWECENGFPTTYLGSMSGFMRKSKSAPIVPDPVDVIWSLTRDADVIDYPTFEQWARDMGYDEDSRKAEKIYRDCLEIALKLRAGIGEQALSELREAGQDY
jgi:hypothetical protein